MRLNLLLAVCFVPLAMLHGQPGPDDPGSSPAHFPGYTADGRLLPLTDYREWIYLTSGLDMSYAPRAATMPGHSIFDNVFVNPESYRSFLHTGTWPDKTMFVLEVRGAESKVSINKAGHSQSEGIAALEVHVKDSSRGGWGFYEFEGATPAKLVPTTESCYSCHRDHAAVDTTFVQFYPTLLPLARQKGTLSANYLKEEAKSAE